MIVHIIFHLHSDKRVEWGTSTPAQGDLKRKNWHYNHYYLCRMFVKGSSQRMETRGSQRRHVQTSYDHEPVFRFITECNQPNQSSRLPLLSDELQYSGWFPEFTIIAKINFNNYWVGFKFTLQQVGYHYKHRPPLKECIRRPLGCILIYTSTNAGSDTIIKHNHRQK
jgi:hypothetical protein